MNDITVKVRGRKYELTHEEARSVMAQIMNGMRRTRGGGGGLGRKPAGPRCPCGAMSQKRAEMRGHKCQEAQKGGF